MGIRISRPLGLADYVGTDQPELLPGPFGLYDTDDASPEAGPAPLGLFGTESCQHGRMGYSKAELEEAEKELELLRKVYGVVKDRHKRPYISLGAKKTWKYDTYKYIKDRTRFFGSDAHYSECKSKGKAELEANAGKLRGRIEPPLKGSQRKQKGWQDAQDVFYAWVRHAYEKKLEPGTKIPELILSGMSAKLKKALEGAEAKYGAIHAGGFNPRPMKKEGYLLGTISDHAFGMAVDIDARHNAQIVGHRWKALLTFTGMSLDESTRKSQWKSDPEKLYLTIVDINAKFVKKLQEAIAEKGKDGKPVGLAGAISASAQLKQLGKDFLERWKDGFFNLPWKMVKALSDEKFVWGAVFEDVDLHHFQLD